MSIRDSESIPNSSSEEDDYEDVEEIEVYEEGFSDTENDREEKKGKDDAGYSDGEVERRKGIPNGDDGFDGTFLFLYWFRTTILFFKFGVLLYIILWLPFFSKKPTSRSLVIFWAED